MMREPSQTELDSAEDRVAASAALFALERQALQSRLRRQARSPYVLAGAVTVVSILSYIVFRRGAKPSVQQERYGAGDHLMTALKAVQILIPLVSAVGVLQSASKKSEPDFEPVVDPVALQQFSIPEQSAVRMPAAPSPKEAWFSEQWAMVQAASKAWLDDYAPSIGAALSYYTLFSLAPLLIIVIAVVGIVFGEQAAQGEIVVQLRGIMGMDGAMAIEGILKAAREPAKGVVATLVGVSLLLLGATAVFAELQSALDRIWRVPAPSQRSGIWNLLRTRLLSFGLVLGLAFMLTVSLVVSAALAALGKWWGGWFANWNILLELLNFAVSFGVFTLLFAMIYKIMPRAFIPWRDVWTGSAVTALLFTVGKVLIGLYLGRSGLASEFGAAGSLVVMAAWVYYSAQIFLFGAEYTWVYANRHGSRAKASVSAANVQRVLSRNMP